MGVGSCAGSGPDEEALREAVGGWRRDGVLLCLLPVFWWPAVAGCALVRPRAAGALLLVVLLSPVVLGVRELYAARRAGSALLTPVPWRPCHVTVRRSPLRPLVLLLGEGQGVVTLGPLGRRVVPGRPWPPGSAPDAVLWLAGEPGAGERCFVWAPGARRLGRGRVRGLRGLRGVRG
ncbi:hypothetical protein OHS33_17070 [Streptomyces sp. NBC_00536]|uniref:hypothetical protein n=1 Tax=Streptomyces sp. NBC_00536 TaxID=2975769 RepID=UPI002E81BE72|nr:hypothetical protein [Streptomyces sp. NBC_00536]WUC79895.1 hypothetical protein OHS33_17070 [Streptomyces sp. NBC_00536]